MNVRCFVATKDGAEPPCGGSAAAWTSRPTTASRRTRAISTAPAASALAPVRRRSPSALQEVVRRVLLPQAPQRAARRRRHLLRRSRRAGLRHLLRASCAASAIISSPAYLPIVERRRHAALRRARARLPGLPPRALRRVQPRVRPRHAVRPAVGRPHRIDPDVAAAGGEVALRLEAGARHARGEPLRPTSSCRATGSSAKLPCEVHEVSRVKVEARLGREIRLRRVAALHRPRHERRAQAGAAPRRPDRSCARRPSSPGRREAEQSRRALVRLAVGLVVPEQLRREDAIPRQAAVLRHVGEQATLPFDSVAITNFFFRRFSPRPRRARAQGGARRG